MQKYTNQYCRQKNLYGSHSKSVAEGFRSFCCNCERTTYHVEQIGQAAFTHTKTEYRTAKAVFLTSNPEEQERRFFYALMLRSRGRKSLDLCGF